MGFIVLTQVLHGAGSSRRLSQNSATRTPSTLCVSIEGFSINHLRTGFG